MKPVVLKTDPVHSPWVRYIRKNRGTVNFLHIRSHHSRDITTKRCSSLAPNTRSWNCCTQPTVNLTVACRTTQPTSVSRHARSGDCRKEPPYLFDCKSRLLKFFSSFRATSYQGRLTFFLYRIERSRWRSAFPWLCFADKTFFAFSTFASASRANVHAPSHEGLWWTEGSSSGVSIIARVARNAKRASMRKYVRGLVHLCLSAACNEGRLTLHSWHHFVLLTIE